jgi:bifunctional non-homologous end joining protein LigD
LDHPEWSFELKWDGSRAIADITPKRTTIWTRHGNNVTHRFPELQDLSRTFGERFILDGEICALDEQGKPQFDRIICGPVTFVAFDVLRRRTQSLLSKPLSTRQRMLAKLLRQHSAHIIRSKPIHGEGWRCLRGIRSYDWLKIRTESGNAMIRERLH